MKILMVCLLSKQGLFFLDFSENDEKDDEYETKSEGGTILSKQKIKKTG